MAVVSIKNKLRRGNLLVGNDAYDPAGFVSISTVTVGSGGASTVEFTSIPSTYTHLQVRCFVQTNRGTYGVDSMRLEVNADTSSSYAYHYLRGSGSSVVGASATSLTTITEISTVGCGTTTGGTFGVSIIDIFDYANTNKYKTFRNLNGTDINGTIASVGGFISLVSALWMKTNAITSLKFTPDSGTAFTNYSHFALYGIKSA
jgi:hypothetical protein